MLDHASVDLQHILTTKLAETWNLRVNAVVKKMLPSLELRVSIFFYRILRKSTFKVFRNNYEKEKNTPENQRIPEILQLLPTDTV